MNSYSIEEQEYIKIKTIVSEVLYLWRSGRKYLARGLFNTLPDKAKLDFVEDYGDGSDSDYKIIL